MLASSALSGKLAEPITIWALRRTPEPEPDAAAEVARRWTSWQADRTNCRRRTASARRRARQRRSALPRVSVERTDTGTPWVGPDRSCRRPEQAVECSAVGRFSWSQTRCRSADSRGNEHRVPAPQTTSKLARVDRSSAGHRLCRVEHDHVGGGGPGADAAPGQSGRDDEMRDQRQDPVTCDGQHRHQHRARRPSSSSSAAPGRR